MSSIFEPKLLTILRAGYTRKQFSADLISGIIVGIVALPLAIAFAIASGVKPEQGIYTAVIAGFVIAALGGSRAQVSGPTGAFIVVIYSIVQQYGYDGLAIATFIAGIILVIMGITKMGVLLKFIPYPVTIGFTSGIALIIFSSQIKDFFGLTIDKVPADFIEKWAVYGEHISSFNMSALGVGLFSLLIILVMPRITHRIPGSLAAIILATVVVAIFQLPVETIGTRFGDVPTMLPAPHIPALSWSLFTKMFSPAITIALLAALESLLSAVVADGMLGTRHRSNTELIAQGIGNMISPIFLGIPATGAIARTATNIKNGGRTPISAMIHAIVLLLIMVFLGKWAKLIPMPALAAILIFVAYNMSEWQIFVKTFKSPKSDISVLLITFFLTVLIDLTVAIEVGVVMAAFLFMNRMSSVTEAGFITKDLQRERLEADDQEDFINRQIPAGVEVFEVHGTLFFGAVDRFKEAIKQVEGTPKILILRMRDVFAIDASGLHALEEIVKNLKDEGTMLITTGLHAQPLVAMQNSGLFDRIGEENIVGGFDEALARVDEIFNK